MTLPLSGRTPRLLLLCLGPCHGEFYLPLDANDERVCPNDRDHPVAVYVSRDAAVDAVKERYCDTAQGILCSDFRKAADFIEETFR